MIYIHILSARLCIWILPIELPTHLPIRCQLIKCNTFMEWNVFVSVQTKAALFYCFPVSLSYAAVSFNFNLYLLRDLIRSFS